MNETGTRVVAFGGSCLRIDYRGRAGHEIVDFFCRDTPDAADLVPDAVLTVESGAADALITVRRGAEVAYVGVHQADAARTLQESASEILAAGSVHGLLFHAAAVSRAGTALLLPGTRGAGKTTLTGRLVLRGAFRYLTDELSYVPVGSLTVRALPRPMNVKVSGRGALADLGAADGWTTMTSAVATLWQPPRWLAADHAEEPTLSAVVFPEYRRGMAPMLTRLAPAECGLRLMGCLLNARNLPDHGFPAVAALARRTPAYSMQYDDAARASAQLESESGLTPTVNGQRTSPTNDRHTRGHNE